MNKSFSKSVNGEHLFKLKKIQKVFEQGCKPIFFSIKCEILTAAG